MRFNIIQENDGWRWYLQNGDGEILGKGIRGYDSHIQCISVVMQLQRDTGGSYVKMLTGTNDKQTVSQN